MKLPADRAKYSLTWALTVVKMLKNKHARATGSTNKFYGLSDEKVAMWLANGKNKWLNYRKFIKTVDKWVLQQERCKSEDANCSVLTYDMAVKALDVVYRRKHL